MTNTGSVATSDWSAVFSLDSTSIYTIWNLDTTGPTGNPTVSPNASWSQVIAPAASSYSLGFCADRPPGSNALPSQLLVNGIY